MHDVVAHSMSVMVVQAGGARRILERDPLRARDAAELIAETGREALVELQRLLGVLNLEPAAAPTLDGLDGLVERARAAGLPVALTVEGERRPLPDGVELAAYRVVQEAITNAIKYAAAAPTEVHVCYGLQDVELHVCDRGPGAGAPGAWAAAATGSSACASACASSAASCTPVGAPAAASRCAPAFPSMARGACMSAATLSRPWRRRHPI